MNFIKKIFENRTDDSVHRQFKRFSKGTFENRALIDITNGKSIKIKTSFEFVNEFVNFLASKISGKVKVTGGILTTKDIKKDINFEPAGRKQFAGVKTYLIDNELSKEQILSLMEKIPDAVFMLSFDTEYGSLKSKVKAPKSGKPGKGNEEPKVDYCTFITVDKSILKEFAFDVESSFKKLFIKHTFIIDSIVVPEEYKNDLEKARQNAKRKGKIIRILNIDGKEIIREKEFIA